MDIVKIGSASGLKMALPHPSWPGIVVRRTASLPFAYVPASHVFLVG